MSVPCSAATNDAQAQLSRFCKLPKTRTLTSRKPRVPESVSPRLAERFFPPLPPDAVDELKAHHISHKSSCTQQTRRTARACAEALAYNSNGSPSPAAQKRAARLPPHPEFGQKAQPHPTQMKAVPAPPAATDHEDDAEHREDALCRACARARTTVVPALGRALDHPLAQLLTGLLTVFALFGDDVQRSVLRIVAPMASRPTESSRASTPSTRRDTRVARHRRDTRRSASSPSTARPTPTTSLVSRTPWS